MAAVSAFPNSPDENFSQKVNKKMYRAAMASIWSKLVADERLCVVESFAVESPKTKAFATQLKTMGLQNKVLLVVGAEELTDNLILASRNMKDVLVVPSPLRRSALPPLLRQGGGDEGRCVRD